MEAILVDTDPGSVADWLARLPYTQPKLAAKLLAETVHALNRAEAKPALRQKLMRLYAEAADKLMHAAESALALEELTLSQDAQIIASRTQRALAEVHRGTLLCLSEQLQKKGWFERDQPKVELVVQALASARAWLGWVHQSYLPLPRGFWHEVHALYRLADERGWLREARDALPSAITLYRELLLLGLTDTRRLTQEQIRWLRAALPELAATARVLPLNGPLDGGRGAYLVDTAADAQPCYMLIAPRDNAHTWLWLDLSNTLAALALREDKLKHALSQGPVGATEAELELIQLLSHAWQQPQRRRHARDAASGELAVVSQLAAIWRHLNGGAAAQPQAHTDAPPSPLGIVNQSPIGLMLRGVPQGHSLRAGDVLFAEDDGAPVGLFFIRWVTLVQDRPLVECGIERIATEARAAEAMPSITRADDRFLPALIVPGNPRLGVSERLLMPGRVFGRLREFRLRDGGVERLIRVTRIVSQSPYYQLMELRASEDF
ncbi:hypothetical protein [Crenobacter cavernae]|uniref:Uncharacterized protein n=1 Tax=Crenobacter cavernae TaxID=2290923 RepID=A0ABY0FED2_9NEIS|nr:hypothetical protein [Crenobacter cavernae]RXZ44598.1 hypothetical protein EBB06_05745 [Crenobacter cavernae]